MSTEKSLALQEMNKNLQSSMHRNKVRTDYINMDSVFAKSIFDFLNGNSNNVLDYDSIKRIIDKSESDIISIGYGAAINKDLEIRITKLVNDYGRERLDIISPETHEAFTTYLNRDTFLNEIDVEKDNIYDVNRIHALQKYLKGYFKEKEEEKPKTK